MPRKRAKEKHTKINAEKLKEKAHRSAFEKAFKKKKKNYWIAIALIAIFCLVLFFNSYFNYTSGIAHNSDGNSIGTRYFLSGPDPYYNMRLCEITLETGEYPFVALDDGDPLLNYPVGVYAGARPPLFNMIAVSATRIVEGTTGMNTIDALGWCMLFLPAIYGALLVFPIYGMGKELFGKKAGVIGAMFLPLIPLHIGSGHGSALSLFDHDSFLILLFACLFFFVLKSFKEEDGKRQLMYAALAGLVIGMVKLTWAVSHTVFIMLIIFLFIHFFFDIFKKEISFKVPRLMSVMFLVGLIISIPYILATANSSTGIIMVFLRHFLTLAVLISIGVLLLYWILKRLDMPWIVSLPGLCILGIIGLISLWFININQATFPIGVLVDISNVIYGSGIYGGQTALTIGEAFTYGISKTVMGFGPVLYWVALTGFILFLYKTFINKFKSEYLFIATIFIIQFWMTTTAGRFLNDLVPLLLVFSGFMILLVIEKIDYKKMMTVVSSLQGIKKVRAVKLSHVFGVVFVCFLLLLPNSFLALDAATPPQVKEDIFGKGFQGASGLSVGQQVYWADVCYWLSQQDTEIKNDGDKPGVLTWWDYGFYLASMSKHPTVADNYQEGLRCAGNFHTAQSENEAVSVLIIRLTEGVKEPKRALKGTIPQEVKDLFTKYLGNESVNLTNIIEDPATYAESYDTLISPEYGNTILREDEINAMYHDATDILLTLSDNELTNLHHEIMETTGYQIRYYGIEHRDMYGIYGVFPFLSDKSTHQYATLEDDWFKTIWVDRNTGIIYTETQLENLTQKEMSKMDFATSTQRKDLYFNSMAYRTYFGIREGTEDKLPENRVPCYLLKHWKAEYISPYISLAKYYEGVEITGIVSVGDIGYDGAVVYVFDENGIPHDYTMVQAGQFSLIAPAGNISLALFVENQRLDETNIGTVTEEEATWKKESNFTTSFHVEFSSLNLSIDGLDETATVNISSVMYTDYKYSENAFNKDFFFDNLIPSTYRLTIVNTTGYSLYSENVFLSPGYNAHKILLGED